MSKGDVSFRRKVNIVFTDMGIIFTAATVAVLNIVYFKGVGGRNRVDREERERKRK